MVNRYHELINKYIETNVLSCISSNNDFHCVSFLQDDGFGRAIHVDCMFVQYNHDNYGFEIAKEVIVASHKYRFTHSIVYEKLEDDTEETIQNDKNEFFTSIDEMIRMGFIYFVCKYGRLQTGYKYLLTTSFCSYFASGFDYPDFEVPALKPIDKKLFYPIYALNVNVIYLNKATMGIYFSDGIDNSYSILLDVKDSDIGFDRYQKLYHSMTKDKNTDFILESYKYIHKHPVFLYNYLIACSYCGVKPEGDYQNHVVYKIVELSKKEDLSDLTVDYLLDLENKLNSFMESSDLFSEVSLSHIIINKLFELYNLLIQDEEKNIHEIWKICMRFLDTNIDYQIEPVNNILNESGIPEENIYFLHTAGLLYYKYRDIIDIKYFSILKDANEQYLHECYDGQVRDLNHVGFFTMISRVCNYNVNLLVKDILWNSYDEMIAILYRFHTHTVKDKLLNKKIHGFNYDFAQCLLMLFYINGDYDIARDLSKKLNIKPKEISKLIDIAEGKAELPKVELDGQLKNLYQNYYTLVSTSNEQLVDSYIIDNYPKLNHTPTFQLISEIADRLSNSIDDDEDVMELDDGLIVSPSPYFS